MGTRVWAWVAALLLLLLLQGHPTDMGDEGAGQALRVQITCFNFEVVRVTWNCTEPWSGANLTLFYRFRDDRAYAPCTTYLVQGGHTAGCLLEGADRVLDFSIHNGSRPLLSMQRWVSDYLKPRSPQDLRFLWTQDAVTVTCPGLPYGGLLYEVQHRTPYDGGWQAGVADVCNVTVRGLDPQHCHTFRARALPKASSFGPDASPSDWSPVSHWQGAAARDSCQQTPRPPWPEWPRFSLVCSLVLLLVVAPLLLALWKAQRVKKLLMPSVPDPKGSFPGLFEHHQGDFQEWIADTQDVARWKKPPSGDQDTGSEQMLEVQLSGMDTVLPPGTGPLSSHTREQEAPPGSPQHPPQDPQGSNVISIGSFTFVMTDGAYMKL